MPTKRRIQGQTYVVKTPTTQVTSLGALFSLPKGHIVYHVRIVNPSGTAVYVGYNGTSDYQLPTTATGVFPADWYFIDPSEIRFAAAGSSYTLYVSVSGEFPGSCPICDGELGEQGKTAKV